jgi:hypothetical protein
MLFPVRYVLHSCEIQAQNGQEAVYKIMSILAEISDMCSDFKTIKFKYWIGHNR